ncbi:hypothetical protein J4558_00100 [Leptolyngbya sp. 15MV]|nr:hypothetical protein J4558_00100 [Leptolyngbya sp. 15MV]
MTSPPPLGHTLRIATLAVTAHPDGTCTVRFEASGSLAEVVRVFGIIAPGQPIDRAGPPRPAPQCHDAPPPEPDPAPRRRPDPGFLTPPPNVLRDAPGAPEAKPRYPNTGRPRPRL